MAQDTTPSIIVYQGDGTNHPFSIPFDKGYYGEVKVAFVRRGLSDYTYEPDTYVVNGRLYAWVNGTTYIYTHTPNPAIGATTYNASDVEQADTVSAIAGQTITVDSTVYTRAQQHDIANNLLLTWTGDMLEVGDYICIVRETEDGQPFTFPNNQKHIEGALDNLSRQIQEVADKIDNALLVDPSHSVDSSKMNPVDWMKSIIRSMDFSVRALRYANGWLDYSLDDPNIAEADKTWVHLLKTENIKNVRESVRYNDDNNPIYYTEYQAYDGTWKTLSDPAKWNTNIAKAQETADTALELAQDVQSDLSAHANNQNNPHQTTVSKLKDVAITNLQINQFLSFDGTKWKNVNYSAVYAWGGIIGNITDQTDLMNKFTEYVRTDGTSVITAPLLMRATDDFKCAIAPYWDGIGFFKLNDNNSVTLMASIEYNSGFEPATTNTYNIGTLTRKWKNLYLSGKAYMSVINNGYDIGIPETNSADTFALKSQVDLAANSGSQLYTTGVWYAKMYAATVVPTGAKYDGRNYADFSQVDSDNNPVIKIYTGASGAWTLTDTITPPANYNGYITVTSKIWDIAEQSGQQGGQVLWDYTHKTFTPYPRIVSFESINVTGNSTVVMPATPTDDSIPNKKYVDDAVAGSHYHPDLFDWKWADHQLNDVQWLRADTFSWQSGAVYQAAYQHLADDIDGKTLQSETVSGTTIQFYLADDGHKICPAAQESNVVSIYNATGVAWYYIIDTTNQRFKLPRTQFGVTGLRDTVGKYVAAGLPNITGSVAGANQYGKYAGFQDATGAFYADDNGGVVESGAGGSKARTLHIDASRSSSIYGNSDTVQPKATQMYLYFYVGQFTQTALENTAGLNAELFNDKVDVGHEVIAFQAPTAANNYTWYRKYADGWVEQGGYCYAGGSTVVSISYPIELARAEIPLTNPLYSYDTQIFLKCMQVQTVSTTGFTCRGKAVASSDVVWENSDFSWQVSGMAA